MTTEKIICLDCDGVLLDYNNAYGKVWHKRYGEPIPVLDASLYHAENYYGIKWPSPEERKSFFEYFNEHGWGMMEALPGALEAVIKLKQSGYKIVVVTSMPPEKQAMRHENLIALGFPIDATISTGSKKNGINPKKKFIEELKPEYFVDDLVENFHNIEHMCNFVFIDNKASDSPNLKFQEKLNLYATHESLYDFVNTHIK